ncbi:MAG: acyl-CoA dehydrogenase family protein [Pseudomonadota bacterium]|nr:acyl-CoA dehydrogenase family protein [Pseudomonadota bacterium]
MVDWKNADDVERLAREELSAYSDLSRAPAVDRAMFADMARLGLFEKFYPAAYGGRAGDRVSAVELCAIREGLARLSPVMSTAFATQIGGFFVAASHAHPDMRAHWIPRLMSGEAVCAVALTEPGFGSDVSRLSMSARRTDDGWVLNGRKTWIMKAPEADIYTVFARTSGDTGSKGISAFLVEKDTPGFSGTPMDTLWPDRVGELTFEDVHVPTTALVGPEGDAFRLGMSIFDAFRPSVGAHVVGLSKTALDAALGYASERAAFGQKIGGFQGVSHLLAEMAMRLKAAKLLVLDAALTHDRGDWKQLPAMAAMSKLQATLTAQFVVDSALQIFGAEGLRKGNVVEHLYREIRAARIYEGTDQIQREIVSRALQRGAFSL